MIVNAQTSGRPTDAPLRPVALLVEDEPLVAMVAEENLREIGFEPIVVYTAAAALRALESGPTPVLAVVDVGLPDQRGDELAPRMRALVPDLKIIIASGYDEAELSDRFAYDASIVVLGKPYAHTQLAEAARRLGLEFDSASNVLISPGPIAAPEAR